MNAWWAQTWMILRISLQERLIYRAEFALGSLLRFLPILTQIFLWMAVFSTVTPRGTTSIAGYTRDAMVGYYLITMFVRIAGATPGIASQIAREIRSGTFRRWLVQPIDFLEFTFLNQLAHKTVYFLSGIVPLSAILIGCRSFLPDFPQLPILFGFLISVGLAFLLAFQIDALLGVLSFWFLEISSLLFVYTGTLFFFSGQMFPLELLPPSVQVVAMGLPLRFLVHFPTSILLGRVEFAPMWWGIGVEFLWVVVLAGMLRWTYRRGIRHYAGYGG